MESLVRTAKDLDIRVLERAGLGALTTVRPSCPVRAEYTRRALTAGPSLSCAGLVVAD